MKVVGEVILERGFVMLCFELVMRGFGENILGGRILSVRVFRWE